MISKFVKGRVYVFIDAANILYSQQTLRWRVDYKKLKEYFEKEVKRIKVSKSSYEWKGNLDVELTIDAFGNMDNFDTLILMSGDSDFASLLDAVKTRYKRVLVMSTKGHVAKELLDRAKYINLKKLKEQISYHK